MKKAIRILITTIILMVFMFLISLQSFAATTVTLLDGNISITDSLEKGSASGASYTATAKGSIISKKTNNITITANVNGKLAFDYSVSGATSFTVDGATMTLASNKCSGSFSKVVAAGDTIPITITSKSGLSGTTVTLNITNLTWEELTSSIVNVKFDSKLGTVTANGTAISDNSETIVEADGTQFTATPVAGVRFIAWLDESDKVKSWDATYKQISDGTETIKALFSKNTPCFMYTDEQNGVSYIFDDLDGAVNSGKTKIVLVCDGTLQAKEEAYTIPSGVTLVIPFDAAGTVYDTTDNTPGVNGYTKPSVYNKLTLANGANIEVYGTINVSANQSSKMGTTGMPTGKYGQIDMQGDSKITVKSGGKLYAWGYITGSGSITAESGATVYEDFQVEDWRGGNATTKMVDEFEDYKPYKVFPMSQYYVQNILVPLTLQAGAIENGYMSVYVSGGGWLDTINGSEVPFIGTNGMFNITSGHITKDYEESTDRLVIDVNGELEMKPLEITMQIAAITGGTTINSEEFVLPVNGNITLNINEGGKVDISTNMALLPGGVINIEESAECTFSNNARVFIYDLDEWYDEETGVSYCSQYNSTFIPLEYVPGRVYTRTQADLKDAEVFIKGAIDATGGYVYTTAGGANIHGTNDAKVKLNVDTATTVTYQAVQDANTPITYVDIPVTTAKLKNADGEYVETEKLMHCCSAYVYSNEVWTPLNPNHQGLTTYDAKTPTCTEPGWNAYETCSRCDYTTYTEINALGHSYGEWIESDETYHKKVCINDSNHIIKEEHIFDGLTCSTCGREKIATSTEYSINGDTIEIHTELNIDVPEDACIITAAYGERGRLISISSSTVSTLEKITLPVAGIETIKTFIWYEFNTIKPFSKVEEISLQ